MFNHNPGDTVYAIVKNKSTFKAEVVSATVVSVSYDEVVLERDISKCCTTRYTFPTNEWKQSVFGRREDAEAMLYEPRGESWRAAHGLTSPLKREGAALYRMAEKSQLSVQEVCKRIDGLVCLADINDDSIIVSACASALVYGQYAECQIESITVLDGNIALWLKRY